MFSCRELSSLNITNTTISFNVGTFSFLSFFSILAEKSINLIGIQVNLNQIQCYYFLEAENVGNLSVKQSSFIDLPCKFAFFQNSQVNFDSAIIGFTTGNNLFFEATNCQIMIQNSNFQNVNFKFGISNITLNNLIFTMDNINKDSIISCLNCPVINLSNSIFSNNTIADWNVNGGVLNFISNINISCYFIIENCLFYNNTMKLMGGVLFLINYEGTINDSRFTSNNATEGGAIYIDSLSILIKFQNFLKIRFFRELTNFKLQLFKQYCIKTGRCY